MNQEQILIFSIIAGILVLFIWGRIRYDIVAFMGLIISVLLELVPSHNAFSGFAHPATITVAVVLIVSRGLLRSGAVDLILSKMIFPTKNISTQVASFSGVAALFSMAMNNIAALALLMPAGIESSEKAKRSPALILMPMAFASILGGLVTLIGTPPNIIIANYRTEMKGTPFGMFDFSPVGGLVAVAGVAFVAFAGWRMIPKTRRKKAITEELTQIEDYISEVRITEDSKLTSLPIKEVDQQAEKFDVEVVGMIRGDRRILAALRHQETKAGDILIVKAGPKELDKFLKDTKLIFVEGAKEKSSLLRSDYTTFMEVVVMPRSRMEAQTFSSLRLKQRYGVHLLGVSRQGKPIKDRLLDFRFQGGDVLLLQGISESLFELASSYGCLPLAKRGLNFGSAKKAGLAMGIFSAAIIFATIGLASIPIALSLAAIIMVFLNIVPVRDIYEGIDWPVIVLLGSMIPLGVALETTGGTQIIAQFITEMGGNLAPPLILAIVLIVTMILSDVMNNAATAVVMAPVSVNIAGQLGVNVDSFLMAVAVGASCAFLTPIGHQNNALIWGPGGYRFSDYWRMGLPLEILIIVIAVPAILYFWPI
jgi:di/tricarboxylate transporter